MVLNQLFGGKFKFVLHCNWAKFAGAETAEYLTTAVDLTGFFGELRDSVSFEEF